MTLEELKKQRENIDREIKKLEMLGELGSSEELIGNSTLTLGIKEEMIYSPASFYSKNNIRNATDMDKFRVSVVREGLKIVYSIYSITLKRFFEGCAMCDAKYDDFDYFKGIEIAKTKALAKYYNYKVEQMMKEIK